MKRRLLDHFPFTFVFIFTGLLVGCSSSSKQGDGTGPGMSEAYTPQAPTYQQRVPSNKAEATHLRSIQSQFQSRAYGACLENIELFQKKYPKTQHLDQVLNYRGLILLARKQSRDAAQDFSKSIQVSSDAVFKQYVLYNLAAAQYDSQRFSDSLKTLSYIKIAEIDPSTQLKFYFLASRARYKTQQYQEAIQELLKGSHLIRNGSPEMTKSYESQFKLSLMQIADITLLEKLFNEHKDSPFADLLLFRLGTLAHEKGRVAPAEKHLRTLVSDYPQTSHYQEAVDILRILQNQNIVNKATVGVLLPLTGKFARFGQRSLLGIELAFRLFNKKEPDSGVTLIVEDAGETPEEAIAALERLYFDHHVVAVIGPLLSKGIDQITQKAQDLNIPLLSLAQQRGALDRDFVFNVAITPEQQAAEIARYAIQTAGYKKLCIMHPQDRFGLEYRNAFWDSVESLGGEITGVESYTSGETDFKDPIDKIAGYYYKEARKDEWDELEAYRKVHGITKNTRKTSQHFRVQPQLGCDAVFIADEARAVGQILPTFAYRDVDNVPFLGISTWNTQELLQRAQKYAENSVFVDSFFAESDTPEITSFSRRFEQMTGEKPSGIEALAYDAALLVERVLIVTDATTSRREVRDRLMEIQNFTGVTGNLSYQEGQFKRRLRVLTVKNGTIHEAG